MKRRYILGTIGTALGGSSLAVGSGAFSFTRTEREFSVGVTNDNEAYLGLRQLGSGKRSVEDGTPEQVEFRFPGFEEQISDDDLGLGTDSVYEFLYDAEEEDTEGLLHITNQGTNVVNVYSEHETASDLEIELFDIADSDRTAMRDNPVELSPGDHVDVGFRIETFGSDIGTHNETLAIVAEE